MYLILREVNSTLPSVAMAIADVFLENWYSVWSKIVKITKNIWQAGTPQKSRGYISDLKESDQYLLGYGTGYTIKKTEAWDPVKIDTREK